MEGDADLRARTRNAAFDLAGELARATPNRVRQLLDWLEGVVAATTQPDAAEAQSNATSQDSNVFFAPHQDVCGLIVRAFDSARERADVCVFTITDDRIANAMVAAHRRGVKVRLVSDDMKSGDLGSDIGRLAHAGIPVRLDRTEAHMHHKFALFDGRLLLNGSYNWTRSACTENRENCVVSTDVKLITSFAAEMERVWDAGAPY